MNLTVLRQIRFKRGAGYNFEFVESFQSIGGRGRRGRGRGGGRHGDAKMSFSDF